MKYRVLGEPLVHFMLIGGLLYVLYTVLNPEGEPSRIIRIDPDETALLQSEFRSTYDRELNAGEMALFLQQRFREKALVEEAMARGLHLNDAEIEEILLDKMRYLIEFEGGDSDVDETTLKAYYQLHPYYATYETFSFYQICFQRDAADAALEIVTWLPGEADLDHKMIAEIGDGCAMHDVKNVDISELVQRYGQQFVTQLQELPLHEWQGPVVSKQGISLIYVTSRGGTDMLPFESVRYRVEDAYRTRQKQVLTLKRYRDLFSGYAWNRE